MTTDTDPTRTEATADDETEAVYERAGMTNELGFGDTPAVVVVDLQRGFTDPDSPLGSPLDEVVEATARLVETAHDRGVPVYYTRCVYRSDLRDGGTFTEKVPTARELAHGSEWVPVDDRLPVTDADHVIDKQQPSAFFETELGTMLTYEGVDTVVIAGATTSGCVRATVVDACSHGYRPMVAVDCVGDRAEDPHEANLFDMGSKYADLLTLEEVIDRLDDSVTATPPVEAADGD
jgi:nicotinamidase-related amidase